MPGVFTATEVIQATAAGARVMKLFPASYGGPGYLRALRGPFPSTPLVPTGGIRIDQIQSYLEAGATAVAVGGELVGRVAPRSQRELELIAAKAEQVVAAAQSARRGATKADGESSGEDGRTAVPEAAAETGGVRP